VAFADSTETGVEEPARMPALPAGGKQPRETFFEEPTA